MEAVVQVQAPRETGEGGFEVSRLRKVRWCWYGIPLSSIRH